MKSLFEDFDLIHSYTRAQAIDDGVLVDLSGRFPELCDQLYKYPVACTAGLWGLIEKAVNNSRHCNDFEGVVWDLLYMSQKGITRRIDPTQHLFTVIVTGAGPKKYHTFLAVCGPGDHGEPVITIMLPGED